MRTSVGIWSVIVLAGALVACGDSGGGGGGSCTDGEKSTDPCPQTGTSCASVGGVAVACCVLGQFEQQTDPMTGRMTTKCQCEQQAQGVVINCPVSATGGSCNNDGVKDAAEQCDGSDFGGATCMSLGMGSGMLSCSGCMLNMTMCASGTPTGGTGGGGTGG